MGQLKRLGLIAASVFTASFFYLFARPGILYYFTDDDIMNLRRAWPVSPAKLGWEIVTFAPEAYRPVGLLFYRAVFALAGLHPRPFHWVAVGFLALNVMLLFLFARTLTQSVEVATLAALIGCFHSRMDGLYFSFSTIYDIVCYTLYFTFLLWYIHLRQDSQKPVGIAALLGLLALNVLALNAKEVAATLPAILLAYEALYHRGPERKLGGVLLGSTILTVIFCLRKLVGGTPLTAVYRPQFSLGRVLENWQFSFGQILYRHSAVPAFLAIGILITLILVAAVSKSRAIRLCCALLVLGPLPVFVAEPRGLAALYIPLTGAWIYAACLLVSLRERLVRSRRFQPANSVFLFVSSAALLAFAHAKDRPNRFFPGIGKSDLVRDFKNDFADMYPTLARDVHILLLDDAFGPNEWTPVGLLQLYYRNPDLDVLRSKMPDQRDAIAHTKFDLVFTYENGHMMQVKSR